MENIKRIVVVRGHGSFSAVRTGVTVANVLSYALGCDLYSIDTATMWATRSPDKNATAVIHAGRGDVLIKGRVTPASSIKSKGHFFGDVTDEEFVYFQHNWIPEKKLRSFGDGLLKIPKSKLKKTKIVEPFYLFPPNITKKKPV